MRATFTRAASEGVPALSTASTTAAVMRAWLCSRLVIAKTVLPTRLNAYGFIYSQSELDYKGNPRRFKGARD